MSSRVDGCTVSPRKSRRKSACFSRTTTRTPARARRKPSIIPAGPPPAMQHCVLSEPFATTDTIQRDVLELAASRSGIQPAAVAFSRIINGHGYAGGMAHPRPPIPGKPSHFRRKRRAKRTAIPTAPHHAPFQNPHLLSHCFVGAGAARHRVCPARRDRRLSHRLGGEESVSAVSP